MRRRPTRRLGGIIMTAALSSAAAAPAGGGPEPVADGYRGIWFTLGQRSRYGDKYSGGLGTYTAKHVPLAVYSPEAKKTFFVWGGTKKGRRHLLAMVSYYDHARRAVPRPTIVHDKKGVDDPHDNPSICLDDKGHVWVFVSGRGSRRPGFKYRSAEPYDINRFELMETREMAYPQPWHVPGRGFLFCFTKYTKGRELYWQTSADGVAWSKDEKLAGFGGHYQTSRERDGRIITAFNWHPSGHPDRRTNLYFLQTDDMGRTWRTAAGAPVGTPLGSPENSALVRDYRAEGRLVYMKDINFDRDGHPVILYIVSKDHRPGPQDPPRAWMTARWTGKGWDFRELTAATHNYDMGSLYIEPDGTWRVIGPTEPGPQEWGTGGEIAVWTSRDRGRTWKKVRQLTRGSLRNHTYVRRPVNAHPDFYAFWADGDTEKPSESHLYFTNQKGDHVWRLPPFMRENFARPEVVR